MVQVKERVGVEMSYCPTLQLLQSRETWGPFLESPPKFAGTGLPKTGGPEKKNTPNAKWLWSFSDLG